MKDAITKIYAYINLMLTVTTGIHLLQLTLSRGVAEGSLSDSIGWGSWGWWVELDIPFILPPFTAHVYTLNAGTINTVIIIQYSRAGGEIPIDTTNSPTPPPPKI